MKFAIIIIVILLLPIAEGVFVQLGLGGILFALAFVVQRDRGPRVYSYLAIGLSMIIVDSVFAPFFGVTLFIVSVLFLVRELISKVVNLRDYYKAVLIDLVLLFVAHLSYQRVVYGYFVWRSIAVNTVFSIFLVLLFDGLTGILSENREIKIR